MKKSISICCCLFWFGLYCSYDYNPFEDISNARAKISHYSFLGKKDSLEIFASQSLEVSLILGRFIKSFSLKVEDNRFWTDTTISLGTDFKKQYTFSISFKDTGEKYIYLTTVRDDSTEYKEQIKCTLHSPLLQNEIIGCFNDTIELSTPRVVDEVEYFWDFGAQSVFKSLNNSLKCLINNAGQDSIGYLWVADTLNNQSPKSLFTFFLKDTVGPIIECINDQQFIISDTALKTGDKSFWVKFYITDRKDHPVKSVKLDGSITLHEDIYKKNIYIHRFNDLDLFPPQTPKKFTVEADDFEAQPNKTKKTFTLYFDSSMTPGPSTVIEIQSITPESDTTTTAIKYSIFGTARSTAVSFFNVSIMLNDNIAGSPIVIPNGEGKWGWQLTLRKQSMNSIDIIAQDTNNIELARKSVNIYHNDQIVDTEGPILLDKHFSGQSEDGEFTSELTPTLEMIVFDKLSEVQNVLVNNRPANNNLGYIWDVKVSLVHGLNQLSILLSDNKGQQTKQTIDIIHNTLPFLLKDLSFPYYIDIGKIYSDTLSPHDNDNDSVVITIDTNSQLQISIDPLTNKITWNTANLTAGNYSLQLLLSDYIFGGKKQDTLLIWNYEAVDSIEDIDTIKFKTSEADFPPFLEADTSQLNLTLSIKEKSGKTPFIFNGFVQGKAIVLLKNSLDSLLQWRPSQNSIGYNQLVITVTDSLGFSDSLFPVVHVIPQNQAPCSLSVICTSSSATLDNDTLHLYGTSDTIPLLFTIHDDDHLWTEHYHVTKYIANTSYSFDPDTTFFTINIIPVPADTIDFLEVIVNDQTQTWDTVNIVIDYDNYRIWDRSMSNKH